MGPKSKKTAPLAGTSQGKATDIPPPVYIPAELTQFGTIGTPNNYFVDLNNDYMFDESTFDIADDRYNALEPALRLANHLLILGLPYLVSFLPKPRIYGQSHARRVWMNPNPGPGDIHAAYRILREIILPEVTWREDVAMIDDHRLGVNHTGLYSGPARHANEGEETWVEWGFCAKDNGADVRPIIIVMASQILDSIIAAPKDTERYMNALFAAAINITHELGHAVYYAMFVNDCGSIWVGDDLSNEIGNSFISYIFDGFYPEPINLALDGNTTNAAFREFRNGHEWVKNPRRPSKVPYAEVRYSVPMAFIQTLFSAEAWKDFDLQQVSIESLAMTRETLCSPGAPFKQGVHARRAILIDARKRQRNPSYEGYEGVHDEEDDEDEFVIRIGPEIDQAGFIDLDWDDTALARQGSVQAERKRKFVDLTLDDDDDDDTPIIIGIRPVNHQPKKIQQPFERIQPPPKKIQPLPKKQHSKQVSIDYAAMRVAELRVALQNRSLTLHGNKGEMVARLRAYDHSHGSSSETQAGDSNSSRKRVGRPKSRLL